MDDLPAFRAPKRRKVTVKKTEPSNNDEANHNDNSSDRVVKAKKLSSTKRGVQFSNAQAQSRDEQSSEALALIPHSAASDTTTGGLQSRFIGAGSSTKVVDADKHMVDYIDRAMAERSKSATTPILNQNTLTSQIGSDDEFTSASSEDDSTSAAPGKPHDKEASTQHLAEVDLGSMTRQPPPSPQLRKQRRKKPRLGRDGKPLRPRPRRGPDPEDVARAELVEKVLHEHGLGTYAEAKAKLKVGRRSGLDEAADEKMAAEFQQQFLDAVAERQEKQLQRQNQGAGVKEATAATGQGPRLGGSRSARAKMAASQAAAVSEKK